MYVYELILKNFITLCLDDDNRVVLQPITGFPDCQGDYINASYIKVD